MTVYRVLVAGWLDVSAPDQDTAHAVAQVILSDVGPGRFSLGFAGLELAASDREPVALPVNSEASPSDRCRSEDGAPFDSGIT